MLNLTDYIGLTIIITTLFSQFHGGSKTLEPESRPPPSRSMHRSQFQFGRYGGYGTYPGYPGHEEENADVWKSDYTKTYFPKDIIPVSLIICAGNWKVC